MSYKDEKSSGHVCAVVGCRNSQKKRKRLEEEVCQEHSVPRKTCGCIVYRFHRFPMDARLRQKWLAFLNRKGFVPSPHSRLCSEHFIDGDRASWPVPIHRVAPKRRMATGENVEVVSIRGRSAGIADEEFLAKVNLDNVHFSVRANSAVAAKGETNPTTVGRLAEAELSFKEHEEAIDFCQAVYEEPQLQMPRRCTQRQDASEDDQQHVPSIVSSYSLAAPHKLFPPVPEPDEVVTGDVLSEDLWQPVDRGCPAVIKQEQEEPPCSSHESSLQQNLVVAKDPDSLLQGATAQERPVILKHGQDSESLSDDSKIQKTVVIMRKELGPGGLRHYTFQEFPVQQSPALPNPTQQYPAEQIPARQTLTQQILAQHILARKSPAGQVPAQQSPPKQVHTRPSPAQQILAHQSLALQNLAQQSLGQEIPVQQIPAQHVRIPQTPPEQITAQQIPTRQSPDSAQQIPAQQDPVQQIPAQQDPAQQSLSKQRLTQESSVQERPAVAEHTPEPGDQRQEQASSSAPPDHNVLRSLLNAPSLSSTLKDHAARWGFAGLSDHGYCKSGPSELRRRVKEATVREALAQLPCHIEKGFTMEASLSDHILNFSVDLYKRLKPSGKDTAGNVFCSPFSIAAALSMALAGAGGNTAKQIAAILHSNDDKIHSHFSSFLCKLPSYAPDVALHIANRMYSEQTFHPKAEYTTLLQKSYDSTIKAVDFAGNADRVRLEVNAWVEEVTRSKIRDLLAPGTVDASTSLILVNAIYFKGLRESQFEPSATKLENFHLTSQTSKTVDMMHQKGDFKMSHCSDLKVTALEIPYKGNKTSMVILLPEDVKGLSVLEEHLTAPKLSALLSGMYRKSDVNLRLPKFKLEQSIGLKDVLMAMGVKDFFTSVADLSGISAAGNLCASDVIHKAFVEVSEEGTEAAAATAIPILLSLCLSIPQVVNFFVDHPFMFLIRSRDPDVVLFMGSTREL